MQMMQQPMNGQMMPQGQMPQGSMSRGYNQQMPQQNNGGGFFDNWFGGDEEANYATGNTSYYDGNTAGAYYNTTNSGTGYFNPSANEVDNTQAWFKNQETQDRQHERFTDYIRDQTEYNDAEGNSYKLSSGYDYNYVNTNTNEYVQTNDASITPGAYSSYTAVTPSDYSSSSSSSASGSE